METVILPWLVQFPVAILLQAIFNLPVRDYMPIFHNVNTYTVKSCKCNTLKLTPVKSSGKVTVLSAHTHLKSLEFSFHFSFFLKDCIGHFSEILFFL